MSELKQQREGEREEKNGSGSIIAQMSRDYISLTTFIQTSKKPALGPVFGTTFGGLSHKSVCFEDISWMLLNQK